MPNIIHIETATEVCSCALSSDGKVLLSRENAQAQSHAASLGVFVEEAMRFSRENKLKISAVSVSCGPGSYTGLRIGVSEAKGLSYGLGVPLIAVPTHKIMAWMIRNNVPSDTLLCPMIDARRMEVYSTIFDTNLNVVRATSADIIDEDSFAEQLTKHKMIFFGNGADKCKDVIVHPNASFISGVKPKAEAMVALAELGFSNSDFVDSAYFEPFYLKEFVATVPKNKVF